MKRIVAFAVFISILIISLCACGNSVVIQGIYENENDTTQKIVINKTDIRFVKVSFDELNEELHQDMGVDLQLTNYLSNKHRYFCKDGVLSVDTEFGIAVTFKYEKDCIIVNGEKFKLRYKGVTIHCS